MGNWLNLFAVDKLNLVNVVYIIAYFVENDILYSRSTKKLLITYMRMLAVTIVYLRTLVITLNITFSEH